MKGQDCSAVERLRPLVGRDGWDYCVVWEVSQDQRYLELKSCCCGGTEHAASLLAGGIQGGLLQPQLGFPPMARACRDGRSPQHPRTAACDALADLPFRIPLDCSSSTTSISDRIHAQALVSGVPAWMYPSELRADCAGSNDQATTATKVLVPVPGGLAELFVQNHVPEDQDVVNFVMSRFTIPDEASTFAAADFQPFRGGLNCGIITPPSEISHSWVVAPPSIPSCDHPGFPWDIHADQNPLCASSLNLFEGTPRDDDGFFEGSADSIHCERLPAHPVDSTVGVHVHGSVTHQMSDIITTAAMAEYSTVTRELAGGHEKESVKEEGEGRGDSGMEGSDPGDDEEEKGGRSGRRLSSKNLLAERRRRKKLNDRLYALRSLVPKISKMDRASILGDAIEFVKELQNQVKKLQEQLEETSPEDSGMKQAGHVDDNHHPNNVDGISNNNDTLQSPGGRPDKVRQTGNINPEMENSGSPKRTGGSFTTKTANASKQHRSSPATNEEKGNQMEPQVEVCQIGANKFHLKVFCEHKREGFVRLLEAMATLGLDVTTVNVTTSKPLVLNIFEVEKRDSEVVQAEQLRSSLLRLAMDSEDGGWPGDPNMAVEKCGAGDHKAHRRQPADMRQHQQVDSHQHAHHLHRLHQHQP